jgi:uncharacterized protein with beta-barrel porin domain
MGPEVKRATGVTSTSRSLSSGLPQRDSALIGFLASTAITGASQVYLRYQGEVGSGSDNHTLNLGVRLTC